MNKNTGELYDNFYYRTGCGKPYERNEEWINFFHAIARRIKTDINPATVMDAGCAMGFLVETLRECEIEAFGMDISTFAIQQVLPGIQPYCEVGSITEPFQRKYDLIVSIEVLEHLSPRDAEKAVQNFCEHTDDVLFSSSPYDYTEITHFNVQPAEYWTELFARHSFYRALDFDATFLTPWAIRFRRVKDPLHHIVREYERSLNRLTLENRAVRDMNVHQKGVISDLESKVALLQDDLNAIANSHTYKIFHRLRSAISPGSWLEKLVLAGINVLTRSKK